MSDDVDLLRRYAASVPPPTADLFESTRSRLVEAIESEVGTAGPGAPTPIRRSGVRAPRFLVGAVAAILLLGLALPLAVWTGGGSPASEVPAWRLTGYLSKSGWQLQPTAGANPYRLTCSTRTTCFASSPNPCSTGGANSTGTNTCGPVSSAIEVSRDGGATWTTSLDPGGRIWMGTVSCSTQALCRVLGFVDGQGRAFLFTTTNAGITWSSLPMPAPVYVGPVNVGQAQLSCTSVAECVVLTNGPRPGGGIKGFSYVTTNGGQSWASSPLPGTFRAYALQCLRGGIVHCRRAGTEQLPGHQSGFTESGWDLLQHRRRTDLEVSCRACGLGRIVGPSLAVMSSTAWPRRAPACPPNTAWSSELTTEGDTGVSPDLLPYQQRSSPSRPRPPLVVGRRAFKGRFTTTSRRRSFRPPMVGKRGPAIYFRPSTARLFDSSAPSPARRGAVA